MKTLRTGNLTNDRLSPEQRLALWKDRPRLAKIEIPDEAFRMLRGQHDIEDNDSADKRGRFNEEMCLAQFAKEMRELREQLKAMRDEADLARRVKRAIVSF